MHAAVSVDKGVYWQLSNRYHLSSIFLYNPFIFCNKSIDYFLHDKVGTKLFLF